MNSFGRRTIRSSKEETPMSLTISSTAFAHNAEIPSLYTCEGKDISPPLAWSGAPAGTKSLALIVDPGARRQGRAGKSDAGTHPRRSGFAGHVSEAQIVAHGGGSGAGAAPSRGAIVPHPRAPAGLRAIPARPPCVSAHCSAITMG
jgi:phosphatidylethanolamine-binding protein (PEBP) family uncharacterized protein